VSIYVMVVLLFTFGMTLLVPETAKRPLRA
jgi:hypothetical protein